MMLQQVLLVLLPALALSRRAFPIGTDTDVEEIFRQINPNIKWDDSNYLVDEAGPYAVCGNADVNGILTVEQKSEYLSKYGANGVGGLISGTRTTGVTVSGAKSDIFTIINEWVKRYPFRDQITEATKFGCSVEPGCRNGQTLVACLFSPKLARQGEQAVNLEIKAVAFTPEEYEITANILRRVNPDVKWDQSHFLENLSGSETTCNMIGKSYWDASKAQAFAKTRQIDTQFIFGWTQRNGNTDEAVADIALGWAKSESAKLRAAKEVGCSLAIGCNGVSDVLVAACLISPGS